MYYAHIREDGSVQTVQAHLTGTAKLCGSVTLPSRSPRGERGLK